MGETLTTQMDPILLRATGRVGMTIRGKWRLDALLGVGGMASVYAATHRNGSRAAVKILHVQLSADAHIRARFVREGYVANRIGHPGAVRIIDDDEAEDGSLFLVMELLDGETLEERRLRLGGRLDVDEALAAMDPLLDVLASAHEKGIVHRDIKPENLFLTREGSIKVLDFGIARLREMAGSGTATGITLGTPGYMSPEHARGIWDEVDARSDIWSVGATMFALIAGRFVHEARTPSEQLVAAMLKPAPSLSAVVPDVARSVASLVDRALTFERAARWSDARSMQEAVRRTYRDLHDAPISSHPPLSIPDTVRNRTLPSAGIDVPQVPAALTTGTAVASGRTDIPLRPIQPPRVSSAIVALAVVALITIAGTVVAIALTLKLTGTRSAASNPVTAMSLAPSASPTFEQTTSSVAAKSAPPVGIEELPREQELPAPTNSSQPDAGSSKPAASKPDWKERRR